MSKEKQQPTDFYTAIDEASLDITMEMRQIAECTHEYSQFCHGVIAGIARMRDIAVSAYASESEAVKETKPHE